MAFVNLSLRRDYVAGAVSRPVAYVEGIYVEPELRHMGVARALIKLAEAWGKAKGCTQLASDVLLENTVSQAFHVAVGFQEVNRTVSFIKTID